MCAGARVRVCLDACAGNHIIIFKRPFDVSRVSFAFAKAVEKPVSINLRLYARRQILRSRCTRVSISRVTSNYVFILRQSVPRWTGRKRRSPNPSEVTSPRNLYRPIANVLWREFVLHPLFYLYNYSPPRFFIRYSRKMQISIAINF